MNLINKKDSECLNQDDDHPWEHALNSSSGIFLQSDCDEQILLHVCFTQAVKIHSLIIQGPEGNFYKLFFNIKNLRFIYIKFKIMVQRI